MNHLVFVLLLMPVLMLGCSNNTGPANNKSGLALTSPANGNPEAGVHDGSVALNNGDTICYTIMIPESYDSKQPTPLIVALHYGGEVTPHYARGVIDMLVAPGLKELNAIIVAPDSIAGPWTNEKNEKMILELMDIVSKQYNIDQNKTLLTGFSMGGHGTWYIGSRNQDRFSAMIPIAGAPKVDKDVQWTTPIYVIHSRADDVVPIKATEEYVAAQKAKGNQLIEFVAIKNLPHFQTPGFAGPLKEAVPWVQKIWDTEPDKE